MSFTKNKIALVTGASSGIGANIAQTLAQQQFDVVVHYNTNKSSAEKLAENLQKQYGVNAITQACDLANKSQITQMIIDVNRALGSVDVLVNNAGIAQQKLFTDTTEQDFDRLWAVNVKGAFLLSQAVLPNMINKKSGSIINISSIWGMVGASCEVGYSASKAAIIGFTKALAKEVGPSNITVNCVAPGVISTNMNNNLTQETLDILAEETPIGRLGTPQDVANIVAFLASNKASFITGQVISPNGGLVI